jgi:hypothetical protein
MKYNLFLLIASALFLSTPVFAQSTFESKYVIRGLVGDQSQCPNQTSYLWVVVGGKGDCIRYYASGLAGSKTRASVFFHGDMMSQKYKSAKNVFSSYSKYNSPNKMLNLAKNQRRRAGIKGPFILMARPGVLGSTGNHGKRRLKREVELMNGALNALKARYKIRTLNLAGQSGGGHITASILPFRKDVHCAVMSSGAISVKKRVRARGWKSDITGYNNYFDPVKYVGRLPKGQLRIFVIADPKDSNTPFSTQKDYATKAQTAGANLSLLMAKGGGKSRHSLTAAGQLALRLCSEGRSAEQIQTALYKKTGKP